MISVLSCTSLSSSSREDRSRYDRELNPLMDVLSAGLASPRILRGSRSLRTMPNPSLTVESLGNNDRARDFPTLDQ